MGSDNPAIGCGTAFPPTTGVRRKEKPFRDLARPAITRYMVALNPMRSDEKAVCRSRFTTVPSVSLPAQTPSVKLKTAERLMQKVFIGLRGSETTRYG